MSDTERWVVIAELNGVTFKLSIPASGEWDARKKASKINLRDFGGSLKIVDAEPDTEKEKRESDTKTTCD